MLAYGEDFNMVAHEDKLVDKDGGLEEKVDHPSHYNMGSRETIEEMVLLFGVDAVKSFCRLNAYKYKSRAPFKGCYEEDMAKADWYLDYLSRL